MPVWMEKMGPESDVVISSRVRLARNFEDIPFPPMMDGTGAMEVVHRSKEAIMGEKPEESEFDFYMLDQVAPIDRMIFVEKYLASPDLIQNIDTGALLVKKDETISIMMNEEDHLRIQCLLPGFQLEEAGTLASRIDDLIEEKAQYSFDEQLGYLTCCPTNVGTGMRASVMMHLPALTMTGYIATVLQTIGKIGLTVRGIYGEGTEALGNMYQISNQITLGQNEEDIIRNLIVACRQIIDYERMARSTITQTSPIELEDRLCRSYGIFANARKMGSKEFMKLLSDVRLAVDLKIIDQIDENTLNRLMIQGQKASLQKVTGRELSPEERDVVRAEMIRKILHSLS